MISVLVADDRALLRENLRTLLDGETELTVCAATADGPETLEQVEKHRPDLVLLASSLPASPAGSFQGIDGADHVSGGGLRTLAQLRSRHPRVKTILLSLRADADEIRAAMELGVGGYVLRNAGVREILTALRRVLAGHEYFSPPTARRIADSPGVPEPAGGEGLARLSGRERQVLRLIAEGLAAKEIAGELHISTKTVEAHRTSLMRKLRVRKATEVVRYAVRHGVIVA